MTNFRRLYVEDHNTSKDPPENPPKDWRVKCQSLLPEGKVIMKKNDLYKNIYKGFFVGIDLAILSRCRSLCRHATLRRSVGRVETKVEQDIPCYH